MDDLPRASIELLIFSFYFLLFFAVLLTRSSDVPLIDLGLVWSGLSITWPVLSPSLFTASYFSASYTNSVNQLTMRPFSSPSLKIQLLALLLPLTQAATSSSSCYYPSGNLAPSNDVPCNTNTDGHSACCSEGVACLSSGLCFDNGLVSRGSCTDSDYADEACASACTDCMCLSFPFP